MPWKHPLDSWQIQGWVFPGQPHLRQAEADASQGPRLGRDAWCLQVISVVCRPLDRLWIERNGRFERLVKHFLEASKSSKFLAMVPMAGGAPFLCRDALSLPSMNFQCAADVGSAALCGPMGQLG